uniref:Vesicle associated membrane protein 3 n=1 Tax=Felis catus TaxID=9685 RepID=A0ABI8A3X3_FELCA
MSTGAPAGSSAASGSNRRLQQTQNQVDEVVDIMRVNVDKVLERDQKLSELDDRADALQAGASQFETSAAKLKRKYWWKNCKMWAIGIVVVVVIIIIIIVAKSTCHLKKTGATCEVRRQNSVSEKRL